MLSEFDGKILLKRNNSLIEVLPKNFDKIKDLDQFTTEEQLKISIGSGIIKNFITNPDKFIVKDSDGREISLSKYRKKYEAETEWKGEIKIQNFKTALLTANSRYAEGDKNPQMNNFNGFMSHSPTQVNVLDRILEEHMADPNSKSIEFINNIFGANPINTATQLKQNFNNYENNAKKRVDSSPNSIKLNQNNIQENNTKESHSPQTQYKDERRLTTLPKLNQNNTKESHSPQTQYKDEKTPMILPKLSLGSSLNSIQSQSWKDKVLKSRQSNTSLPELK